MRYRFPWREEVDGRCIVCDNSHMTGTALPLNHPPIMKEEPPNDMSRDTALHDSRLLGTLTHIQRSGEETADPFLDATAVALGLAYRSKGGMRLTREGQVLINEANHSTPVTAAPPPAVVMDDKERDRATYRMVAVLNKRGVLNEDMAMGQALIACREAVDAVVDDVGKSVIKVD